ncbi:bifunctional acetate--CoA ligase family protein/GNAT family N-acetyltransferase [Roseomonas sp. NAR14]|uniref:Bifunctional acetate--CoA ligase family protein/GNAT family N-acetyltransferase n=1 Tax=Roseomonas acroporae TaxID=2937791 RepID=A0A9X1Y7J5_9PROT|nr:bifunctional acetate--CoA ligase family protein/GNAT family N-acetyltransferase [Roseomonas acroporae]MCK8783680.1 bifunctional acetate--CoA ligase family protein/GNAT family N-acetyltransferase [Roseomonas acroporae]
MTVRNLDALFEPRAVVLVRDGGEADASGRTLARNLEAGGFAGRIMHIEGEATPDAVAALPEKPDLAILATPAAVAPALVAALGARGCRAAIVIPPGFGEGGDAEGLALRDALLRAARPHTLRLLGPNCVGLLSPAHGLNASTAHLMPARGDIAFVAQSGAIAMSVLDWAAGRGIGFSHVVTLGDMADVDLGDVLDHLALDRGTRAILLYVESVTEARKFMSAGRIAARAKPVILVKAGGSESGARAALAHTGALAGADLVQDAAFRRAGMLRVATLRELFDAAATLGTGLRVRGPRLTIVSNSGGAGVLAADALEAEGGVLAPLTDAAREALDAVLPPHWSRANPVDLTADASPERHAEVIGILRRHGQQDAILVLHGPTGTADGTAVAEALAALPRGGAPILACWVGEATAEPVRRFLSEKRIPAYEMPEEAVRAFMHLVRYRRNQEQLMQTPAAGTMATPAERERAAGILRRALDDGRTVLTEPEAKGMLAAYGVPVVETRIAANPFEAGQQARALSGPLARALPGAPGTPVVLKILSPEITHKSDVGGVRLDLRGAAAVRLAATEMLEQVAAAAPGVAVAGFTVQPMVDTHHAPELIAGIATDPVFGPVILFGAGGIAAEVVRDRAVGLPPLNLPLARELIGRTRVSALLAGYRNVPAADLDALAKTLIRLAELAIDLPGLREFDINPLLADARGVVALDARAVVGPPAPDGSRRLALSPYPAELERELVLGDGRHLCVRPIRPEDEPALVEMVARCTPEDLRLRFFGAVRMLHHEMAARLSQIDYDREMAFVALEPGQGGEILGTVRIVITPDGEAGEYAVMVRSDLKGIGLGYRLMLVMLDFARQRGLRHVYGDVLRENTTMLRMARNLGGKIGRSEEDEGIAKVDFDLAALPSGAGAALSAEAGIGPSGRATPRDG